MEEPPVEGEPDEDIASALALAHRHHSCILFDSSVGDEHFICNVMRW